MRGNPRIQLRSTAEGDVTLSGIYDRVKKTAGSVPNLYQALANAPEILRGWIDFAWSLREDAESDRALRELAVLRVAQIARSEYVWRSHWKLARKAGVDEPKIAELARWHASDAYTQAERAVLAMTDELLAGPMVGDETRAALAAEFDDREVVELVLTASWYVTVAGVVAALDVPPEDYHTRVPGLSDFD